MTDGTRLDPEEPPGLEHEVDEFFEIRPTGIPTGAVPVFDDATRAVVGYSLKSGGIIKVFDLEGTLVSIEEPGLEKPLFDPLDLIFFAGGVIRAIGSGIVTGIVRTGPKVAATAAAKVTATRLPGAILGTMRTTLKRLSVRKLRFTVTTLDHMRKKGRYVPLHILHLGIKYGKRQADPQGAAEAFLYTTKMLRNGKEYALEIVVRESDWTILHFLYK